MPINFCKISTQHGKLGYYFSKLTAQLTFPNIYVYVHRYIYIYVKRPIIAVLLQNKLLLKNNKVAKIRPRECLMPIIPAKKVETRRIQVEASPPRNS
jgi:hypothetical protein